MSSDPPPPVEPREASVPDSFTNVRLSVEAGMADSIAGRTIPVEVVRSRFGLAP
jgi:hypothetical protein